MSKNIFNLDENTRLRAYSLFGRTKDDVDADIKIVTEWLKTQPHLPEIMDEAKVRNFLIMTKFSIEKTKQKIDMYYTIRSIVPDWYDNANPKTPEMKQLSKTSIWALHPTLLDGLYRIHFLKLTKPGTLNGRGSCLQLFNIFELRLQEDCMVGDVVIVDFANFGFEDFTKMTPTLMTVCFSIYQKVYSMRIRAVYYVNSPSAMSKIMVFLKTLLKPKIFERFHVHHDSTILKEIMSDDILPKDFGGQGPSILELNDLLAAKTSEFQSRFDKLDMLRVKENLRPEKLQNDEFFGYYGNFKKLDVD